MRKSSIRECPSELITEAIDAIKGDEAKGLVRVDMLLRDYSSDPRLHFLKGSVLAGLERYPEAHAAMRQAVTIAPGYAIARFQLGLLELTSGEAAAAQETWRPLQGLAPDDPLRIFAVGLDHLIRDDFEPAVSALQEGMRRNTENPVLNKDMQLIIDKIEEMRSKSPESDEPVSSTHWLLQQYTSKSTKH